LIYHWFNNFSFFDFTKFFFLSLLI